MPSAPMLRKNDGAGQELAPERRRETASGSLTVFLFVLPQRSVWRAAARGTETAPNPASACEYEESSQAAPK